MAECIKCKSGLPDGAMFCPSCGKKQAAEPRKHRKRANGTGTVFRYRGGWVVEYTEGWEVVDGDLRRKTRRKYGFKTSKDAEDALAEIRARIQAGTEEEPKKKVLIKTVAQLWESYSASELPMRGKSTQDAYNVAWRKRIKGTIGDRPIDEIGLDDLNAIVAGCTYDPAKDVRDLMSILFQRAIVDRQTTVNPAPMMTLPLQQSEEVVPWNASEISTLWKAWGNGERVAGYCLLMIYSGMMTGELLRCKEEMINWEDQQIIGCGLKTKKRKEMPIHFPHIIEPILRELCATKSGKRGGEGYILDVSERAFYERFAKMKTALDIRPEVRPYSSRHSTGTELTLMGVEPAIIIDIMRHKNYTTTLKHYTKIPSNVLVDALNAMAEHDKSVITGV